MLYFIEPETLSSTEKSPKINICMVENILAEEKARLQRCYQIDRDQKRNVNVRAVINQIDKINQDYRDQIDSTDSLSKCNLQRHQEHRDLTINEANNLPKGMKKDCYLTDSLSENF
ncbi:4616_t:CDS:2 [Funneliformis mosseae]|uniref:4616_t:CDS:1 n=1 Tax=Funneliformis mosseae TaxID=27381 RepID=A0A9N9FLW4_FUNMO|nr:4616_t:CDS:2 [Funneliformis mosseae]